MIKFYIVVEPGLTELKAQQILLDTELQQYINKYNYTSIYKQFTFKLYKSIFDPSKYFHYKHLELCDLS